jgi:hypothetical protein
MRPGAVPTIQVDERAGMMVWGANLDVLEQLRTAADAVAGPAPAAERSSSEQA